MRRSLSSRPIAILAVLALCAAIPACSGRVGSIGPDGVGPFESRVTSSDASVRENDAATTDASDGPDATLGMGGTSGNDGGSSGHDASSDAPDSGAGAGCGEFIGDHRFTCSKDGTSRGQCVAGVGKIEPCANGCLREGASADDLCMGTSADWACDDTYSTSKQQNGNYYMTAFGCWVDSGGDAHQDSGDNCVPECGDKLHAAGMCNGLSGADCEESINWYIADAGRFGCMAHVRITNPANGKSVIALVIDEGPRCSSVEDTVSYGAIDASGRIDQYLFGTQEGIENKAKVHVVEVDASFPIGPAM